MVAVSARDGVSGSDGPSAAAKTHVASNTAASSTLKKIGLCFIAGIPLYGRMVDPNAIVISMAYCSAVDTTSGSIRVSRMVLASVNSLEQVLRATMCG